jgi:hypothetical protein
MLRGEIRPADLEPVRMPPHLMTDALRLHLQL